MKKIPSGAKLALKIFVSAGLLAAVFWRIDWAHFAKVVLATSWPLFVLAFLILFCLFVIPSLSLKILFRGAKMDLSLAAIYSINLKSMFYALAVPGDVGAGLSRLLKFSKAHRGERPSEGDLTGTVLVVMACERLLNMFSLVWPLPLLLFLHPLPKHTPWLQKAALLLTVVFLFLFFLSRAAAFKGGKTKIGNFFAGMGERFRMIPVPSLLLSSLLSLAYQTGCLIGVDMMLAASLGIHIPWPAFITIAAAIRFLRFLPVTLSGIGIREGFYPYFLGLFGVPLEQGVSLGLLGTALVILCGLLGGVAEAKSVY